MRTAGTGILMPPIILRGQHFLKPKKSPRKWAPWPPPHPDRGGAREGERAPGRTAEREERGVPEGLYVKCNGCKETIYRKEVVSNQAVCPRCAFHFRISARERLSLLCDSLWEEFDQNLVSSDPLKFKDSKNYADRLVDSKAKTDSYDALVSAVGTMGGLSTVMAVMEYGFIGGSMGVVVGEKVTRAVERAIREKLPVLVVSCSGGARMMEGTLSLMQMATISAALARLDSARLPFISLMTDPTTGGVTVVCDAGRSQRVRAWDTDRFRGPPRDRTDDPSEVARGLPARGVPSRARHARHGGGPPEPEGDAGEVVQVLVELATTPPRESLLTAMTTHPYVTRA